MISANELPKQYRYQYRLAPRLGQWEHSYELIGQHGAVHLHISEFNKDIQNITGSYGGGIEFHYRTPHIGCNEPPSHDECWLLKAPCWHDGSNLWASEYWIPLWENSRGNHDLIFRTLAQAADKKFSEHLGKEEDY